MNSSTDRIFAVDTETTGLEHWNGDRVFLITACDWSGKVAAARLGPAPGTAFDAVGGAQTAANGLAGPRPGPAPDAVKTEIPGLQTVEDFRQMLADPTIVKVFHNLKFDVEMLKATGFEVRGELHDTMLLVRILFPDASTVALKPMARLLLKADTKSETAIKDYMRSKGVTSYTELPNELLTEYALDDVRYTMALYRGLMPKLAESQVNLYNNERRLARVVGEMETRGMLCDLRYAEQQRRICRERQDDIQKQVDEIAGWPINLNSPTQLQRLLFGQLKLHETLSQQDRRRFSRVLRTPKGDWSTKREALRVYDHPVIHLIMDFRMYGKMAGTYFDRFIECADKNGIIHPSFWQAGTRTGRFSSSDPSFQTIPSVTSGRLLDFDRDSIPNVRRCFIVREGYHMYAPDYSQIELRIASVYAGDRIMQDAFIMGRDIHDETTKAIFPDDWESMDKPGTVDKPKRTFCKMVNFGVLYGMGVGKLSADLGVPIERAQEFLARYFRTYAGLHELMQRCTRDIITRGYVESIFGRRAKTTVQTAYKALNYLIQGTAADVMKVTMVRMHDLFKLMGVDAYLLNTVHDEIIFEIAEKDDTPEFHANLKRIMEDWPQFAPVPLTVNCKRVIGYWSNHEVAW